jgi:hypothetical protein
MLMRTDVLEAMRAGSRMGKSTSTTELKTPTKSVPKKPEKPSNYLIQSPDKPPLELLQSGTPIIKSKEANFQRNKVMRAAEL